jgi:hypothetical protein
LTIIFAVLLTAIWASARGGKQGISLLEKIFLELAQDCARLYN